MPKKNSKPRPLSFRLSAEASERINERINSGELTVFKDIHSDASKLDRLWYIADKAAQILKERGQSTEGCSSDEAVRFWLERRTSKEISVFKALCQAVDENWLEVFDRSLYTEVLIGEQRKSLEAFMNSFLDVFIQSSEEKSYALSKYCEPLEPMIGSDRIDLDSIKSLIKVFLEEFAVNGRKIRFQATISSKPCYFLSVEIKGKNQDDKSAVWNANYDKPYPSLVEAAGWWWKGLVSIRFQVLIDENHIRNSSCEIYVPAQGYAWTDILFDFDNGKCTMS